MKTSHAMTRCLAGVALALSGSAFGDVGMLDGADSFTDFKSSKSRAEVRGELDAARQQGLLTNRNTNIDSPGSEASVGARGPAGSRYTARTREEVQQELADHRRTQQGNAPNIYRPN